MNDAEIWLSFVRGKGLISEAIGYVDFFSHVDCYIDGQLWGARSDHVGGKPPGVWGRPDEYEAWAHRTVFALPCTTLAQQSYYAFVKSQEGKPYDSFDIEGIILNRDWRSPDHWICSELQGVAGESADMWGIGDPRKLFVPDNHIPPGPLAMLASGREGTRIVSSY